VANKSRFEPLLPWERRGLWVLVGFFVVFGVLVEYRSAFLKRRMTDLNCYLRASWAVRQGGARMYHVFDDNLWHYNYPPLFAILLTPLADPPCRDLSLVAGTVAGLAGSPQAAGPLQAATILPASRAPFLPDAPPLVPYVPFSIAVAVFYLLNLVLLALALHVLASALEDTVGKKSGWSQPRWSRRWWILRVVPMVACLSPLAHTLMRSQANLYLLALFCGLMACLIRGQTFRAGLCLAGAICLKIFPAYLLLIPLWRRDPRMLGGCAAGLVVGLGLIPLLAMGPRQTVICYRELGEVLLGPALGVGDDKSRANELIEVTATDSQSYLATIHNTLHLDPPTRPRVASPQVRRAHWLIGGTLTLLTLLAGWRHRLARGVAVPLLVGSLILMMLLLSPVCHTHYFSLALPLYMGLVALSWEREAQAGKDMTRTRLNVKLLVLMGVMYAGFIPPVLPMGQVPRDAGLMMYVGLLLWGIACVILWRWQPAEQAAAGDIGVSVAA